MEETWFPEGYGQDAADEICDRISSGESLRTICAESGHLPCERTVFRWIGKSEPFSQQYARARQTWADAQLEEIVAVSRDGELGADHKRVQIDTLKWAMGKLNGKYSDKVKHVGGDEGDAPIAFTGLELTIVDPAKA